MSKTSRASNPQYHVHSLQEYVLGPLSTAASRIEHERAEVTNERDAFREFRDRVADIDTESASSIPQRIAESTGRRPPAEGLDRVREAYRETVMDVPHYEAVYDEPFVEHVAAEFGPELARQLHESTAVSFTPPLREALWMAAQRATYERRHFLELLDEEAASLEAARNGILDLLQSLSSTVIPEWHRETFVQGLTGVAERRQETLHTSDDLPAGYDHSLCTHLYDDEAWNYPVLTAVARVREGVTLGEPSENPSSRRIREST